MDENVVVINDNLTIPFGELDFRFSTSSGPGGQHVNKTSTKVTLRFDIAQSPTLDDETRARLLNKLAQRIDKAGVLQVHAQDSRSQFRNRETAVSRFQQLLALALIRKKPRKKRKKSRAATERRLTAKKKQGDKKKARTAQWD
jgi:ribosome-associated protein